MAQFYSRFSSTLTRLLLLLAVVAFAGCDESMSPLHGAVLAGDEQAVRQWIASGKSLEVTYDEESAGLEGNYARRVHVTPLMLAAVSGRLEMVKMLVEGGADIYATSNFRAPGEPRTAFDDAVDARRIEIARYLWSHSDGKRLGSHLMQQISHSCSKYCNAASGTDSDTNVTLFLLSIAPEEQRGQGMGDTLCSEDPGSSLARFVAEYVKPLPKGTLTCASFAHSRLSGMQREALVDWMLSHGAEIDYAGNGYSALMAAASSQDVRMVNFLLARGARPNAANAHGLTAIGAAASLCMHGDTAHQLQPQLEVVEALVRAGADTSVYAQQSFRTVPVLPQCCRQNSKSLAQRRICEIFHL